jgi:hypothetical protein
MLSEIKDVVVMLAAVTATGLGVYGVRTWKRQLVGTAEWDLARRWLRRVYGVRESLQHVRGVFMTLAETESALLKMNADDLEGDRRIAEGTAAAYDLRWAHVQTAMSDLDIEALEAEVLWGRQAAVALEPLRACIKELRIKLHVYLFYLRERPINDSNREKMEEAERVVFALPDDGGTDQFGDRLAAAIAIAEAFIQPRLNRIAGPSKITP